MGGSAITYRLYREGDEHAIVDVFNAVFARPQALSQWQWMYRHNPVGRFDISLAVCGEKVVGQSAGVPLVLSHDGQPVQTSRYQHMLVHADFRGHGVFVKTLVQMGEHLQEEAVDFVLGFPNANALPGYMKVGGYVYLFDIFQYHLDATRGIAAPADGITTAVDEAPEFTPADVNLIAQEVSRFAILNVRSLPYLTWRYHCDSGNRYRIVRAFSGGEQLGFAVVKPYLAARSIDLLEFICRSDESVVRTLLHAIHTSYRQEQLNTINIWSMEHYPVHQHLRRVGFQQGAEGTYVMYRTLSSRCSRHCNEPTAYYLAMGDSDVY